MGILSVCGASNLFTKKAASKCDPRQTVPEKSYTIPDAATRLLMAQLVYEEAMETIEALGCWTEDGEVVTDPVLASRGIDIEKIIDGACDTIYVATGVLIGMGVPDMPHLAEVCEANDAKFPGGVATMNKETGKYLKPEGWKPPDHQRRMRVYAETNLLNLRGLK